MGIFQKFTKVFNRAPVKLYVTFDGQREPLQPGLNELPDLTVPFAKNQNPVMGSADPANPHMSGGRYLVVEESDEGFGEMLSKEEWEAHLNRPCRQDEEAWFSESYGDDPKAKILKRGGRSTAKSRYEAGGNPGGLAAFSGKD